MVTFLAVVLTVLCVLVTWSRLLHAHPSWEAPGGGLGADVEPLRQDQGFVPEMVVPLGSGPGSLHGQLLFAQPVTEGCMSLDCLLTDSDDEAAWPLNVVVALPANPWLAAVEEELVLHWLAQGELVGVSISGETAAPRIRIACHRTTMLLDQHAA